MAEDTATTELADVGEQADSVESPVSEDYSTPSEQVPTFTVKVDGKETRVTEQELRDGYMRQADYTRGKQAVASDRERLGQAEVLMNAIEADPQGTLKLLQTHFASDENAAPDEELDPYEKRLNEVEQRSENWERQQRDTQLRSEIKQELDTLHGEYGDFDNDALLQHAIDYGIANLDAAYAHKTVLEQRAQKDHDKQRADGNQAAIDAKRNAGIEGGHGRAEGSTRTGTSQMPNSIAQAYADTVAEYST